MEPPKPIGWQIWLGVIAGLIAAVLTIVAAPLLS